LLSRAFITSYPSKGTAILGGLLRNMYGGPIGRLPSPSSCSVSGSISLRSRIGAKNISAIHGFGSGLLSVYVGGRHFTLSLSSLGGASTLKANAPTSNVTSMAAEITAILLSFIAYATFFFGRVRHRYPMATAGASIIRIPSPNGNSGTTPTP